MATVLATTGDLVDLVLDGFRAHTGRGGLALDAFPAGAAIAARSLGYGSVAVLILDMHLGPEQIARMFMLSASKASARDLAMVLSAGAIARFRMNPSGWTGEVERRLAQEANAAHGLHLNFEQLSGRAAALVKKRWREIERLAST